MAVTLRETEQDRRKQIRLLEVFAKHMNCNYVQIPSTSKKYRIDAYLFDDSNAIRAWVECKWYSSKAHLLLNVPKYTELTHLSRITKAPSFLLFREEGRWGYICLHNGKQIAASTKAAVMGGTPKGRVVNPDDVEPVIKLDSSFIVWGN